MKICLIIDSLPGYHKNWGGSEIIGFSLFESLEKESQSVFILTSKFDYKKSNFPKNIFQIKNIGGSNSKFYFFLINVPLNILPILYSFYVLKKIKPDIIHFHSKKLFLPVMIASIFLKIPTVFTILDYFIICPKLTLLKPAGEICKNFLGNNCTECYLRRDLEKKFLRPLFFLRKVIFNFFIKKLKTIIVFTKNSKKVLEEYGLSEEKIKIIYQYQLSLENNLEKNNIPFSKEPFLLFSGAICERHKGLHILIMAMADVVSIFPNIKLKVAGNLNNKAYREEINNLIKDLNLENNIEFIGQINNMEILKIALESKAIIIPEQWLNPGPVILLESMLLGKPVIASKIGGIPEFIKDGFNGFIVDRDQPKQFAEKIIWLLKNEAGANLMGQRAKEYANISFNNKIKKIVNLYKKITNPVT